MRTIQEIEADIAFVRQDIAELRKMKASTTTAFEDLTELLQEKREAELAQLK